MLLRVLRDPIWQSIGVAIAIVTFIISIMVSYLIQDSKKIEVITLANTSLIEVERSISQDIQVLYKGENVSDLSFIQVKLENVGDEAIILQDYVRPIRFVFSEQSRILEAAVIESNPGDIGLSVDVNQNIAALSPVLLNPKDRVILRFLVTNISLSQLQPFVVEARIVELQEIQVLSAIEQSSSQKLVVRFAIWVFVMIATLAALIFMLLGAFAWIVSGGDRDSISAARDRIQAGVVGVLLVVVVVAILFTLDIVVGIDIL